jgi:hypothetical protein
MSLPARDRARLAACSSRSDGSQRRLATLVAAAILALPIASASVLAQSSAIAVSIRTSLGCALSEAATA